MKIGILTFPSSISYGAVLQMYALYHAVNELGYSVDVINYHNPYMRAYKHITHGKKPSLKTKINNVTRRFMHKRLYKEFKKFEMTKMTKYPKKVTSSHSDLVKMSPRYDAVLCGSDQVWNPDITDSDMSYFLDFCGENTRRISYAPSFGVVDFKDKFTADIKKELEKFYAVSVREEQGREYLKTVIDREVTLVSDPTFLVPREHWNSVEKEHPLAKGDYILYYTIRSSHTLIKHAAELSKKTGCKLIIVGGNSIQKRKNKNKMIDYAVDASPGEWLYLVRHAKYVVTNSFHGTAFSIIFRRNFYLECSSYTNSRLEHITGMLGLSDRIVKKDDDIIPSAIDYSKNEEKLAELTESSMNYLKNSLS